jgi:hypothetical protein
MKTDNIPQVQQALPEQQAERPRAYRVGPRLRAAALGLLLALLSPLAVLAPKLFARSVAQRGITVFVWQIVLLLIYSLQEIAGELSYSPPILVVLPLLTAWLLIAGLLWLLAAYLVRPLAAAWDETPRRSYWKGGLVLLAFVLPMPIVMGQAADLLHWWLMPLLTGDNWREVQFYLRNVLSTTALAGLFCVEVLQMIRGLASLGGKETAGLTPICRDCGYSLEGVVQLYEAGRPRDESNSAIPRVCSECGCTIAISLDPAIRQGTAWTRGGSHGPKAWLATVARVVWSPRRFFETLPLGASRRAALWFWLINLVVTLLLVTGVFAVDYVIAGNLKGIESLLPRQSMTAIRWTAIWGDPAPSPPLPPVVVWLLECSQRVVLVATLIIGLATLVLGRSANQICRLMSRHRERNLHPAGLLLVAYLSPVVLTAGVLVLAVGVMARLIGGRWLPIAPQFARRFLGAPEDLAILVWLAATIPALGWCYLAARRAAQGIRYANH